mgnify:CR=1 FL=1|jgi:hypothetical protein
MQFYGEYCYLCFFLFDDNSTKIAGFPISDQDRHLYWSHVYYA